MDFDEKCLNDRDEKEKQKLKLNYRSRCAFCCTWKL